MQKDPPLQISRMHEDILRYIYTFHFLNLEQVMRLLRYSPNSKRNCQKLLKELRDHLYLDSPRLPRAYLGNPPFVYCLSREGLNYLRDLGYDTDFRFRQIDHNQPSYSWLNHLMALNDFLICACLLPNSGYSIALETVIHEWIIKRRFNTSVEVRIKKETGGFEKKTVGVIPDAFINFRFRNNLHMPLLVELDRDSESRWKIREKVYSLLAYVDGPYAKLFEVDPDMATIAFVVADNNTHRRDLILHYIESVLKETNRLSDAEMFYVAALPSGILSPIDIFLSPLWHRPFDYEELEKAEANARFPGQVLLLSNNIPKVKVYTTPLPLIDGTLLA
jgi:hypothetical protein